MNASGSGALKSCELPEDEIAWASSTEISTDSTRANASLDTMLSTKRSFLWSILSIFNFRINKFKETVIHITKWRVFILSSGLIPRGLPRMSYPPPTTKFEGRLQRVSRNIKCYVVSTSVIPTEILKTLNFLKEDIEGVFQGPRTGLSGCPDLALDGLIYWQAILCCAYRTGWSGY